MDSEQQPKIETNVMVSEVIADKHRLQEEITSLVRGFLNRNPAYNLSVKSEPKYSAFGCGRQVLVSFGVEVEVKLK